jgi:hypothetical protein
MYKLIHIQGDIPNAKKLYKNYTKMAYLNEKLVSDIKYIRFYLH